MLLKLRAQISAGLSYLASSAWFAYLTIVLLILKILWDMWAYKDFVIGDTLNYYMGGYSWHTSLINNIVWSPLYTAYMGTLMSFTDDAYSVIIVHRLIILLVLAVLVLALMRRLLPHSIAWLVAAWWVVLPVTFNALFEVHLFAVIPTLIAYIAAVHRPTRWMRGIALGFFVIATVLARNELISAPIVWFLLCVFWEFYLMRKNHKVHIAGYLSAYGVPLMAAGLLIGFFYARSEVKSRKKSWKEVNWMNAKTQSTPTNRRRAPTARRNHCPWG